jgi:PAS domain S-box-containing protein
LEKALHSQPQGLPKQVLDLIRALESIPAGISVADLDGKILHLNQRILDSLGYSRDELLGRSIEVLYGASLSPDEAERIKQKTLTSGWRGEVLNYRKDGSSFPVFLETSVLRNDSGEPVVAVAVARDISEQHAFQERLLSEVKVGTLGLIAHNVAHEVRNHLSAIKMSLYMLENEESPEADKDTHFSIAREELDRIELFLRTLENYANPPKPIFKRCGLVDVVNKGIEEARPLLLRKSITLFRQYPRVSPELTLDRNQFAQSVSQVIQNASEAVNRGGEVHVVLKRQPLPDQVWWLVEIRDNGTGIAPEHRDRVFEPFFSTAVTQLGLGLSNVGRILTLHGGQVSLTSTTGGGTTVILKVPQNGPEAD